MRLEPIDVNEITFVEAGGRLSGVQSHHLSCGFATGELPTADPGNPILVRFDWERVNFSLKSDFVRWALAANAEVPFTVEGWRALIQKLEAPR